jgi:hemoglobin
MVPGSGSTTDRVNTNSESGTRLATEITVAHLATLVHRFYDKVRIDPELGPVFYGAVHDWDEHLDTMVRFWSTVMLASRTYKGNPLAAHLDINIVPSMFDRWLALWKETTEELFVTSCASLLQQKAQKMGQNMRFAIFGP